MEKNTDLVLALKKEHGEKYRFDFSFEKHREKCRSKILRKDSTLDLGMFIN